MKNEINDMVKMKIAFLGWGSLIWDQRELRTKGDWNGDGPSLPIEYRRISRDGGITLVLYPRVEDVKTLWADADFAKLSEAIENLCDREGVPREHIDRIGFAIIGGRSRCRAAPGVLERIQKWGKEKGLDAAVWTDLPENPDKFKKETGMELNDDNIIKYLKSLEGETLDKAKEYIQETPEQIDTSLRRRIRQEMDWE